MQEWQLKIELFVNYLKLEKSLSHNSVVAYKEDVHKLASFASANGLSPLEIDAFHLRSFIKSIVEVGLNPRSQSRILSGIKAFFKFLLLEDMISEDPAALLETPRIGRKLPETLSLQEIDILQAGHDLSTPEGRRNKAIIEVLYSCGLRVSELVSLKISNLYFSEGYIRVIGKGNKERLVPISPRAIKDIHDYLPDRNGMDIKVEHENILFLNRRGAGLTRVMIFTIVRNLAEVVGLKKIISPHTFRHSFATHMVEGGADLRSVQEMLGHESIITTEIYTHLDREYLRDAILRFHPRAQKDNM